MSCIDYDNILKNITFDNFNYPFPLENDLPEIYVVSFDIINNYDSTKWVSYHIEDMDGGCIFSIDSFELEGKSKIRIGLNLPYEHDVYKNSKFKFLLMNDELWNTGKIEDEYILDVQINPYPTIETKQQNNYLCCFLLFILIVYIITRRNKND